MKTIKVGFVDFWKGFNKEDNDFIHILQSKYNVEISSQPQYLFYSVFGHEHMKYQDAVRIFYTGECVSPDFNDCDYAIGFDWISFSDRYVRVPIYRLFEYRKEYLLSLRGGVKGNVDRGFCSFVYSNMNGSISQKRIEFFQKLSEYKTVSSGGRILNNVGGAVKDKLEFSKKYKFSIAIENTIYPGYTTEKITQAYAAGAVPIYLGDPCILYDFNESAFINISKFRNIDEAIEYIQYVDQDVQLYEKYVSEPLFKEHITDQEPLDCELRAFLFHIFDQDSYHAIRRAQSTLRQKEEKELAQFYAIKRKEYALKSSLHKILGR